MTTPNKQRRQVNRLLKAMEKDVAAAFKAAISAAASDIDFTQLVQALEQRDIERAIRLVQMDQAAFATLAETVRSAYISGGALAGAGGPAVLSGKFSFDGRHTRAAAWFELNIGALVESVQGEALESVRAVILDGLENNRPSASMARDITGKSVGRRRVGGVLGLNSEQTDHLIRARSILSDPKQIRRYFIKDRKTGRMRPRYKLSDRRFDAAIREAIAQGRGLSGRELDAIMDAHKNKALGYRGRVIAKDQSRKAVAAGRDEGFRQMRDRPDVSGVTKRWQWNLSQNPRQQHVDMDGTTIDLDEKFVFDGGVEMDHSHDEAGGAEHTIGCNCITFYRVQVPKG